MGPDRACTRRTHQTEFFNRRRSIDRIGSDRAVDISPIIRLRSRGPRAIGVVLRSQFRRTAGIGFGHGGC